jgi:hypothetical protein
MLAAISHLSVMYFTRADVKARLYLIDFKFHAKHAGWLPFLTYQ